MSSDSARIYTHDAHHRLSVWAEWARGSALTAQPQHILARLVQMRIDDEDELRPTTTDDFTLELQATDKAVARLKHERRLLRRLVMRYYMRRLSHPEIATSLNMTTAQVRKAHLEALDSVERHVGIVYAELKREQKSCK